MLKDEVPVSIVFRIVAVWSVGVMLSLSPASWCVRADTEEQVVLFQKHDAAYWLDVLRNGAGEERRTAAIGLGHLAPKSDEVLDALVAAMRQREDEQLRTFAASALRDFGPFAKRVIPDLVAVLTAPSDEEFDTRSAAASALSTIAKNDPSLLIAKLNEKPGEAITIGLVDALGWMRTHDPRAIQALISTLDRVPSPLDRVYTSCVGALAFIGDDAGPIIVDALHTKARSPKLCGLIDALGRIYSRERPGKPPEAVLNAILPFLSSAEDDIPWRAARALGETRTQRPDVIRAMIELLERSDTDAFYRAELAEAIAKILPDTDDAILALLRSLGYTDPSDSTAVCSSLAAFGSRAVGPLLRALQDAPTDDRRIQITSCLGAIGPAAGPASAALAKALTAAAGSLRVALVEALGRLGADAVPAIPNISAVLTDPDPELAAAACDALGNLAPFVIDNSDPRFRRLRRNWERPLQDAALRFQQLRQMPRFDRIDSENVRTIERAAERLRVERSRRLAVQATILMGLFLGLGVTYLGNWRARRWILTRLGRRWEFVVGECDCIARVTHRRGEWLVSAAPRSEALSAVVEVFLREGFWPPDLATLAPIRSMIDPRRYLRIEADESSFSYPWVHLLAPRWSGQGPLAGQVCLVKQFLSSPAATRRKLVVSTLQSFSLENPTRRENVLRAELSTVESICRQWGAHVVGSRGDATRDVFSDMLVSADIIHLAAHGSQSGIFLSDGLFGAAEVEAVSAVGLQCRLLVLSACDVGSLNTEAAFLWGLVRRGVNVLAPVRPVQDYVCTVLFPEIYRALLPKRSSEGICLSDAVAEAVQSCTARFLRVPVQVESSDESEGSHWRDTLDSLVLYGDPTLNLVLKLPSHARSTQ